MSVIILTRKSLISAIFYTNNSIHILSSYGALTKEIKGTREPNKALISCMSNFYISISVCRVCKLLGIKKINNAVCCENENLKKKQKTAHQWLYL